jgi:hypothetical protein
VAVTIVYCAESILHNKVNLTLQIYNQIKPSLNWLLLIVILSTFLYLPVNLFSGYSVCMDANTRVSINDSFCGTYYFFWTNLLFLPTFFFTTLLLRLNLQMQRSLIPYLVVFYFLFCAYQVELWDYIASNSLLSINYYDSPGFNNLLTNT